MYPFVTESHNSGYLKLSKQKIRSICESLSLGTEGSLSYYLHPPRTGSEFKRWTHLRKQWTFPFSLLAFKLYKTPLWSRRALALVAFLSISTSFHWRAWGRETILLSRQDQLGYGTSSKGVCLQTLKGPLNSHLHKNIKPANCQTR